MCALSWEASAIIPYLYKPVRRQSKEWIKQMRLYYFELRKNCIPN